LICHLNNHIRYVIAVIDRVLASYKINEPKCVFPPYHQIFKQIGFRIFAKRNDSIACNGEAAIIKHMTFFSTIITINVHSYLNIVSLFLYTFNYDN
jgi:hypothetical protein